MIARASALFGALSGSLGSITAKNARSGLVLAHRPIKINAPTSTQLNNRSNYSRAIAGWRSATDAERLAWSRLAQTFPQANSLGVSRALSGFQLFIKYNLLALQKFTSTIETPPEGTLSRLPVIVSLDFLFDVHYNIEITMPPAPGTPFLWLSYGRTFSTTRPRFFHDYRNFSIDQYSSGTSTRDFFSTLDAFQGRPQPDEWIFIQAFTWSPTKFASQKIFAATQVRD